MLLPSMIQDWNPSSARSSDRGSRTGDTSAGALNPLLREIIGLHITEVLRISAISMHRRLGTCVSIRTEYSIPLDRNFLGENPLRRGTFQDLRRSQSSPSSGFSRASTGRPAASVRASVLPPSLPASGRAAEGGGVSRRSVFRCRRWLLLEARSPSPDP